jgi:hypothetical protein
MKDNKLQRKTLQLDFLRNEKNSLFIQCHMNNKLQPKKKLPTRLF